LEVLMAVRELKAEVYLEELLVAVEALGGL
jgi:hypothetical protein